MMRAALLASLISLKAEFRAFDGRTTGTIRRQNVSLFLSPFCIPPFRYLLYSLTMRRQSWKRPPLQKYRPGLKCSYSNCSKSAKGSGCAYQFIVCYGTPPPLQPAGRAIFRLILRAAGKIESFNPALLLYLGNSLVDHFVVFAGAHLQFFLFCPCHNTQHNTKLTQSNNIPCFLT